MIQKITDIQEGVTFYVDEYGNCVDIDVDPKLDTLVFQIFSDANISGRMINRNMPMYSLRDVKKQFPNIKTIAIENGVSKIDISNMMFPNVELVSSNNPYFVDGKNLLIGRAYSGMLQLRNTFCKKEGEAIDLECVSLIADFAFEGCMSRNIINPNAVDYIQSHSYYGTDKVIWE